MFGIKEVIVAVSAVTLSILDQHLSHLDYHRVNLLVTSIQNGERVEPTLRVRLVVTPLMALLETCTQAALTFHDFIIRVLALLNLDARFRLIKWHLIFSFNLFSSYPFLVVKCLNEALQIVKKKVRDANSNLTMVESLLMSVQLAQ